MIRPITSQLYHAGLVWIFFLFLLWISWPVTSSDADDRVTATWRTALLVTVAVTIMVQLGWAARIYRREVAEPYSPDRDGAVILHGYLAQGRKVVSAVPDKGESLAISQYFVVGLEPYFTHQPFQNVPYRFWFWGGDDDVRAGYLASLQQRSAVVVVEETSWDLRYRAEEAQLMALGYRRDRAVCGQLEYPILVVPPLCHAFYVPPAIR